MRLMLLFLIYLIPLVFGAFVFYKIQYWLYKYKNKFVRHLPVFVIGIYMLIYVWFYFYVYSDVWPGDTYAVLTVGIANDLILLGFLGMIIGEFCAKKKFKSKQK